MKIRFWLAGGTLIALSLLNPQRALAYTCSATSPGTQTVTNINTISGNPYAISGTVTVTCIVYLADGLLNGSSIIACLNLTGASGSTNRTLSNGTNTLQYNLYQDSAHTQIWGATASSPPAPVVVVFNLGLLGLILGGVGTVNVPIYTYIAAGQTTAVGGSYTQTFAAANATVNYSAYYGAQPACSTGWASGGSFPFMVQANVINACNIGATNVSFGSAGVLNTALTATGTITAQCTAGDTYSIALNAGSTAGATVTNRMMALAGGSATVSYGLYSDGGHSTIWGDGTSGTITNGGTATGGNQAYTVYGLVPTQSTPLPGNYGDTVTATITY
jgi:spore coat protein U-like protein